MSKFSLAGAATTAAAVLLSGGVVLGAGAPGVANAACSLSTPSYGADLYYNIGCSSYYKNVNETAGSLVYGTSSVNVARASASLGTYRLYLWDQGCYGCGNKLGLSNGSTTQSKGYDLTNFGRPGGTWNDEARYFCIQQGVSCG